MWDLDVDVIGLDVYRIDWDILVMGLDVWIIGR